MKTRRQTAKNILKTISDYSAIVQSKETHQMSKPFDRTSELYQTLSNPSKIVCGAYMFDAICEKILETNEIDLQKLFKLI